jgi:sulfite reductase (NADPH) flavoprotein alpha-component
VDLTKKIKFSSEQRKLIEELVPTLEKDQSIYLSSFLGSWALSDGQVGEATSSGNIPLTIIYGSESGNSEMLAATAGKKAKMQGFKPVVKDMFDITPADLEGANNILIYIATWGEGDPPERAEEFYNEILSDKASKYQKDFNFAVCALGDSSYVDFCEAGKKLDKRFEELGGKRFLDRIDLDVDFEEGATKWTEDSLALLKNLNAENDNEETDSESKGNEVSAKIIDLSSVFGSTEYTPSEPFEAELIEKLLLNEKGSAKETYHFSIGLEGSGIEYEPGDALGIVPQNDEAMIDELLEKTGLNENDQVEGITLREALRGKYDINALTKPVIEAYGNVTENASVKELAQKKDLQDYIYGREIIDLLTEYPAKGLTSEQFVKTLRKLPPRLYSIASSQKYVGDEVHLTVATVRYNSNGRDRKGVASTYLSDVLNSGDKVKIYTKPNKNFKLPQDGDTPIIMVGPGTGIAPFRAFIQEREVRGDKGKNWLFFGDQKFTYDFLYQIEWIDAYKKGLLNNFDVAFSRDQEEKIYVQHKMWDKREELFKWLEEGAKFYVCGDEKRMAKDVDAMLHRVIADQSGKDEDFAKEYVSKMKKAERYLKDVY